MNTKKPSPKKPNGLRFSAFLRYRFGPTIALLANRLGIPWNILSESILKRSTLLAQAKTLNPTKTIEKPTKKLDIIFTSLVGNNTRLVSVDLILGRALQARGHNVRFVICDQALPMCEVKSFNNRGSWNTRCAECFYFGSKFLTNAGFNILYLSDLASPLKQYETHEWDEYVDSSLLKHYRSGTLSEKQKNDTLISSFRQAANISFAAGQAITKLKPDRVIMSHGIYCTWGPAREAIVRSGIPLVTPAEGKKRETIKFNWTTPADWWDISKEWALIKSDKLSKQQEDKIDKYLESRVSHTMDARVYNFGPYQSSSEAKRKIGLDPEKPIFSLFTNVLWDAASISREVVFKNPVEWVIETINWFANNLENQLIIKVHPAETIIGTNQPFSNIIKDHFPELPENVYLIEASDNINSWSIINITDVGIVHTSTIGLELALKGVPCILVSKTHYRGKGFTIDANTKEEYFELLDQYGEAKFDGDSVRALAKRYAYILFERYQLPFPFTIEPITNQVTALRNLDEKIILSHPTIKLFINSLEMKKEFLLPD